MISFFKNFARGVLYVLVLPALLVGLALYAVISIFVFIYLGIKGLILFFTGRSLYEDLPEDKEAKKRLGIIKDEPEKEEKPAPQVHIETTPQPVEETKEESVDPFYVPEYLKTQEQKVEPIEEKQDVFEEIKHEEVVIEKPEPEIKEEEPIIEEKTTQNSNILHINDVDEIDDSDDDKSSGINIDFE